MRPAAKMPKLTRRSRILITIALVVVLLLLIGPRLVDGYVDWLWFGELGYRSVFTTQLVTKLIVFLVVWALVGGVVFAAMALAYRARPVFVPTNGPNDPVARYRTAVMTRLRQPERQVLDTLVDAGVARSRSDALAWCVRLVGEHTEEWLTKLRDAMRNVEDLRSEGPQL